MKSIWLLARFLESPLVRIFAKTFSFTDCFSYNFFVSVFGSDLWANQILTVLCSFDSDSELLFVITFAFKWAFSAIFSAGVLL